MRRKLTRLWRRECSHSKSVVATSAGVRRKVCRSCGHISFEMTRQMSSTPHVPLDEAVGI